MPQSAALANRPQLPGDGLRHPRWRDVGLAALSFAGVSIAFVSTSDSLPVATAVVLAISTAAGMHARLAMGRWKAAAQIVCCAALLATLGAVPRLVGAVLISGLAGAELIARCTRRSAVLQAGGWTGLVTGVASLSGLLAVMPLPPASVLREALGAFAGGFLSAPLMVTLGPLAESLFGHRTRLTMSEWLNYEHPLLRKLALTAPGTFQHSINVGVLADAAAGAIGADPLLARVGGLYHDVGKMRAPEYFIENQHGANPHDLLDPWESARILRAHVFDGAELVTAHRMGDRIAEFVREHHGTTVMRLLRDKSETLGSTGPPDEAYAYPGPRPRSRETAIVLIADQLEATARATPPVDDAACNEMVHRTIERNRADRQLDDSGMTPRDLSAIQPALARALQAMYHRRLMYPASETESERGTLPLLRRVIGRREP